MKWGVSWVRRQSERRWGEGINEIKTHFIKLMNKKKDAGDKKKEMEKKLRRGVNTEKGSQNCMKESRTTNGIR